MILREQKTGLLDFAFLDMCGYQQMKIVTYFFLIIYSEKNLNPKRERKESFFTDIHYVFTVSSNAGIEY